MCVYIERDRQRDVCGEIETMRITTYMYMYMPVVICIAHHMRKHFERCRSPNAVSAGPTRGQHRAHRGTARGPAGARPGPTRGPPGSQPERPPGAHQVPTQVSGSFKWPYARFLARSGTSGRRTRYFSMHCIITEYSSSNK